jgi:hypothetical protein
MSKVFVLDTNKRPLNPVHPRQARRLLNQGEAAIFRRYPFTIILKKEVNNSVNLLRVKIDPGAKTTGLAVVNEQTGEVVWAAALTHRGFAIRDSLTYRRQTRRSRRNRHTRYRQPRFLNRKRGQKWLPPSLMSRIHNILTVRATGSFNISTPNGLVQGISFKSCKHIHKKDGYSYVA